MAESGMIYAIRMRNTGFVKIGFTTHLEGRRKILQTGNPNMLDVLAWIHGTRAIEHRLHQELEHCACVGEWFHMDDGEAISALRAFGKVHL